MPQQRAAARCCPSCSRRPEMLVDPDCLLCAGAGLLVLGNVDRYTVDEVALTVEIVLENQARHDLGSVPLHFGRARDNQRAAIARMRHVGYLAPLPGEPLRTKRLRVRKADVEDPQPAETMSDVELWVSSSIDERPVSPGFACARFVTALVLEAEWFCRFDPLQLLLF